MDIKYSGGHPGVRSSRGTPGRYNNGIMAHPGFNEEVTMTDIPLGGGSGSSRAQQRFNNNFTSSDPDTSMGSTMAQRAGVYGGGRTPYEIRQDSINWGQEAGLGNRISFAGESGRDILNPNEMKVNAPSVEGWKQEAQRKIMMDRMDEMDQGSETSGQGLMNFLGSGYNKLDEILDFKGMKEQVPYLLDNFIPGYEPPEGYYDDDYDGEPMAELGMNPFDVADLDDDNIAAQILAAQGYGNDEIISLLASRSI
tara:strand:+ start:125 stop:883 length:759 start_codon:yes stop_codon:yes gene_type:complete